ncbi:hypothetical protein PUNSTDRAFT_54017 [Punctularia strigosozonata HHB-11173 SS5]|uniref:uncharacterized protein n=1 Tax=Punctularia strigosozonata (strain HHB-11173) TaxID=741275 RepID=UPI0004418335|nr:uncharacterized protein PUNSTDRAFT_54017 [Punctularia strigosozonata HHB-11173 SS5]EIN06601.1 hypothetical protein PUNSTDRAFT_54017 [Punctularia strigosozonata HHB-11173 SS5]
MHAAHALIHVYACALYLTIRASALPLVSVALVPRRDAIINVLPDGNVTVFNPDTQLPIPQGPATDGAGVDFSVPAVLWIAFSAIIGAPLALAGVRLARFTTGCALGLAGVVCSWAAVVNTIAANGVADLTLTLIVFAFFAVLFSLGLLSRFRAASLAVLAIVGGLSLGVRIALLRPGLLVPIYAVNWAIIALLGAVGGLLMIFKHRVSVVLSSAATGTFLIALGVDLVLNKQDGMSRGLRFLFDRNTSHLADVFEHDYKPRPNTQIILAASLAAVYVSILHVREAP